MNNDQSVKKEYRCPQCNRFLYDRRRKNCGWCGAQLPEELLFTKEELEKLNQEMTQLQDERRQLKAKEDAKGKKENERNAQEKALEMFLGEEKDVIKEDT